MRTHWSVEVTGATLEELEVTALAVFEDFTRGYKKYESNGIDIVVEGAVVVRQISGESRIVSYSGTASSTILSNR